MKVNIGCGYDHKIGYLNVDIDPACKPDLLIKSIDDLIQIGVNSVDEVLAKDVLEHIPRRNFVFSLLEIVSIIRVGGIMHVQTTSLLDLLRNMEANLEFANHYNWTTCLFGNQRHPGDYHYNGFTEQTLRGLLYVAGMEIYSPITIVDGWMLKAEAVKVRDWQAYSLDNETYDNGEDMQSLIKRVYHDLTGTEIDEGQFNFLSEHGKTITKRNLVKYMHSLPAVSLASGAATAVK